MTEPAASYRTRAAGEPPGRLPSERIPSPVRSVLERLASAGHPSVLVGGCVRDLLEGRAVKDFDVATPAAPARVLEIFDNAVPIGLRHGTVLVPTAAGPVDVTSFRAGPELADDLARRDFTVNALALRAGEDAVLDLHGGLEDLRAGRLRAVGDPDARLAEDPLRALRAARLAAEHGWQPDADLLAAMARAAPALATVARERIRSELERLLLAARAGLGLRLLRSTGIEQELAPGVSERAPEIVDALPRRRDERLAGWLLGISDTRIRSRLRLANAVRGRVERLLREHPVQARTDPFRPPAVRRLLHRFDPEDIEALFALAAVAGPAGEFPEPEAVARLDALRAAVTRERASATLALQRSDLALDGADVMRLLGSRPGPEVGEALRYLTECVLENPADNTPEALGARLEAWAKARP